MSKNRWSVVVGVVLLASVVAGGVYFSNSIGEKGAGRIAKIKNSKDVFLSDDLGSKKNPRRRSDVDDCSILELYVIDSGTVASTSSTRFDSIEELFDYFERYDERRNCTYEFDLIAHDLERDYYVNEREIQFFCRPDHALAVEEVEADNTKRIICAASDGNLSRAVMELWWYRDTDRFQLSLYRGNFMGEDDFDGRSQFTINQFDHFDRAIIVRRPVTES